MKTHSLLIIFVSVTFTTHGITAEDDLIDLTTPFRPAPDKLIKGHGKIRKKGITAGHYFNICVTNYAMKLSTQQQRAKPETVIPKSPKEPFCQWSIYVPLDYKPSAAHGVFVYINNDESDGLQPSWLPILDKMNLIWICPLKAGNNCSPQWRHAAAFVAPMVLQEAGYNIDTRRIFTGGFGEGGRISGRVCFSRPDVFRGIFAHCGFDYCKKIQDGIVVWHPIVKVPQNVQESTQFRTLRVIMYYGQLDPLIPAAMGEITRLSVARDIPNCRTMINPTGKREPPDASWFKEGLLGLDAEYAACAEKLYTEATREMRKRPCRCDLVLEYFTRAAAYGYDKNLQDRSFRAKAIEQRDIFYAQWLSDIEPVEKSYESRDARKIAAAKAVLLKLGFKWKNTVNAYMTRYKAKLKEAQNTRKPPARPVTIRPAEQQ